MQSNQSAPTAQTLDPRETWNQIVAICQQVAEMQPDRLASELQLAGVTEESQGDPDLLAQMAETLGRTHPEQALNLFHAQNPQIDLAHLDKANPYLIAAGTINTFLNN